MKKRMMQQIIFSTTLLTSTLFSNLTYAVTEQTMNPSPMVTSQILEKVKSNDNWKLAFATANHGQIVFMNVSPNTNPNNEIGMETHPFDQFIIVVEGEGKAELNGKIFPVKANDMIFIPQGTAHNVINLNQNKSLKILSFYSSNDIPANAIYKKKTDEPQN